MLSLELIILIVLLIWLIYKWATATYGILRERGVPHDQPVPLFGTMDLSAILGTKSFMKYLLEMHLKYKNSKVYGIYSMRDPFIIVNDVELIKMIGIKDFDNFTNHRVQFSSKSDSLSRSLIALQDLEWKRMRNTLTPAFTGSKMRLMFELINECCMEAVKFLKLQTTTGGDCHEHELEMKDFFTRFTNDVIASAAFGIKVNSFQDRDNEFSRIGRSLTEFKGLALFKAILMGLFPKLMKALKVSLVDQKSVRYFNHLVLDAMKYREDHHIVRPDMINLLMEAKKQAVTSSESRDECGLYATEPPTDELDDTDLVAQCLLFFIAGFETVATSLSFTMHELLENPDVQQALYEEVLEMEEQLNGRPLDYETLVKMSYMDMVISESLRKWPPAVITDRVCSRDYTLRDDDGNVWARLRKNDNVWVPILGLHHDPENFENPEIFDPLRFSEENKHNIKPLTYLPFGVGPRNCIGNRFALMETKAIIYHILLHFKVVASPKGTKDMLNSVQGFQMKPKEGFWMKLAPRAV